MSSRPWNLRLNLDDFNGLVSSVYSDSDRALLIQGIALGANGGDAPDSAPAPFLRAWEIGRKMYQEALEFQAAQSERGKASADKRRERNGTAQPSRREPPFEPPFERVFEPPIERVFEPPIEPNDNLQSTNINLQSTNPEQRVRARDGSNRRSGRIPATDWAPLQEHRDLCSVRNVDCDAQLSRFRERSVGQTDTDQGWTVRFRQWLGSAKPERRVSPEQVASPTLQEWMEFAKTVNTVKGIGKWPKELAEAGWHENQAKLWKWVQDWRADCQARVNKWAGMEATYQQRGRS